MIYLQIQKNELKIAGVSLHLYAENLLQLLRSSHLYLLEEKYNCQPVALGDKGSVLEDKTSSSST